MAKEFINKYCINQMRLKQFKIIQIVLNQVYGFLQIGIQPIILGCLEKLLIDQIKPDFRDIQSMKLVDLIYSEHPDPRKKNS